jgi:hypothetical protein
MSSLTIEDTESSFLKGKAEFDEWLQQFEMRWYMPQIIDMLGQLVNTMPIENKLRSPYEAATMEKVYRNMRGG